MPENGLFQGVPLDKKTPSFSRFLENSVLFPAVIPKKRPATAYFQRNFSFNLAIFVKHDFGCKHLTANPLKLGRPVVKNFKVGL